MSGAAPSFRTKTGQCTLTGGKLVLSREGARGAAAQALIGASVRRVLLLYAAGAFVNAYVGVASIRQGRPGVGAALCAFALFLAVAVLRSWNVSAVPEIALDAIRRVDARRPRPPFTRGHFVVHFDVGGGSLRKRLVILPGVAQGGAAEFEKAVAVLTQAGLLKPAG